MIHRANVLAAIVLTVLMMMSENTGAKAAPFHSRISDAGATIFINGALALTVSGPLGRSRAESACIALQRSGAEDVYARELSRRKWEVVTRRCLLVLKVGRSDGREARETVEGLARTWAIRINRLISEPPLTSGLKRQILVVPTGGFRSLRIGGMALATQISTANSATSVTSATFDSSTRTISIQGLKPGFVTVDVVADDGLGGHADLQIPVLVEDLAGAVNTVAEVTVFGNPASRLLVLQAVRTAVYRSVRLHAGAYLELISNPSLPSDDGTGDAVVVPVTVRAVGSDLIPVEQRIVVNVQNDASLLAETAQTLFYSNNPETVKRPQTLFSGAITGLNSPVRLVFHHQNISSSTLTMVAEIVNTSLTAATVRIVRGLAPAADDPVDVGALAGTQFLREWEKGSGQLLSVPAQSRLEILDLTTGPDEVFSGIVEVTQTSGAKGTLLLNVAADQYDPLGGSGLSSLAKMGDPSAAAMPILPLTSLYQNALTTSPMSHEVYASPAVSLVGTYAVGGAWMHLVIGTDSPIVRVDGSGGLLGNYGVIYSISVTLSNPTAVRRQVTVAFESDAGDVSGAFSLGSGQMTTVSDLSPPNEQEITRITLAPGASQTLQIQTTPLSGSAYPAAIIAHAL